MAASNVYSQSYAAYKNETERLKNKMTGLYIYVHH